VVQPCVCVCPSNQTPAFVWKVKGLKIFISISHINAKKLILRFLKFCLGAEIYRFFLVKVKPLAGAPLSGTDLHAWVSL